MVGDRMDMATAIRRAVEKVTCHRAAVVGKDLAMVVRRAVEKVTRRRTAMVRRERAMAVPQAAASVRIPCIPTSPPATAGIGWGMSQLTRTMENP
jgi:hypothetical protein